jgi:hypothetical protein
MKYHEITDEALLERFKGILSIQSESYNQSDMLKHILLRIQDYKDSAPSSVDVEVELDDYGNLYVTKSNRDNPVKFYPTILSHVDTVHKIVPDSQYKVISYENDLFELILCAVDPNTNSQQGIGGDDKVGIHICLESLDVLDNVKLVFFKDEEVGCVGSSQANLDFFKDSRFLIQADRQGVEDMVIGSWGSICSDDFAMYALEKAELLGHTYRDIEPNGGLTDAVELSSVVDLSCMNFSCGYYNPHSDREFIIYEDVCETADLMYEICSGDDIQWEHVNEMVNYRYGGYGFGGYNGYSGSGTLAKSGSIGSSSSSAFVADIDKEDMFDSLDYCSCETPDPDAYNYCSNHDCLKFIKSEQNPHF